MMQSAHNKYEREKFTTSTADTEASLEAEIPGSLPEARDAIEAILDDVLGAVQSRPFVAVIIAALVGYALATATK